MTDNNDDKTISVAGKKTLTLKPSGISQGTVRQDMGRGRTKAVVVETRKRRINRPEDEKVHTPTPVAPPVAKRPEPVVQRPAASVTREPVQQRPRTATVLNDLSAGEMEARRRALAEAQARDVVEAKERAEEEARRKVEEAERIKREAEEAKLRAEEKARGPEPEAAPEEAPKAAVAQPQDATPAVARTDARPTLGTPIKGRRSAQEEEEEERNRGSNRGAPRGKVAGPAPAKVPARPKTDEGRRQGKLSLTANFDEEGGAQRGR